MSKLKVALCLHGKFDSLTDSTSKGKDGFDHIKKRIFAKVTPDVFIHSWDIDKRDEITDLYNPVASTFQKQIDFSPHVQHLKFISGAPRTPETILSHFYSVSKSVKLACEHSTYDIIIKARFDLGRINRNTSGPHNSQNPHPVQCISFEPELNMTNLYMANWQYIDTDGPADMWFYSNQDNMSKLQDLYKFTLEDSFDVNGLYARSLKNINDLPNAIKLYKQFFIKHKLWNKKLLLDTIFD